VRCNSILLTRLVFNSGTQTAVAPLTPCQCDQAVGDCDCGHVKQCTGCCCGPLYAGLLGRYSIDMGQKNEDVFALLFDVLLAVLRSSSYSSRNDLNVDIKT
jgi:hypothetical protein